jgi:hypothetical protein
MRRVWAGIVTVWVFLSLVAVLAWTHVSPAPPPRATSNMLVVKRHGKAAHRVVLAPAPAAIHATTQTSPPPP